MAGLNQPALTGLIRGLQVAFDASEFFDLTVLLKEGGMLHAHRVVVCTYSPWLKNMCSDIFMDPTSSMIHMADEDPQLVREMFFFFYHGFYSAPIGIGGQHDIAISQKHIGMYNLAIKYNFKALQQYTTEAFQLHLAKCTTLDFLSTIESAYLTGEASPLRKIVVSEAGVRCRELMAAGSRARHIFFSTMAILPAFERDMFVRYFEVGAGVMCKNCRGWIDQSAYCNRCTSVGLAKTEDSDDEQDFGAHGHDEFVEDSSQTLIADLTG